MPAHAPDAHRRTVAVLCVGASAMFAAMYSTQSIVVEIARDLDASASAVGLTISVVVLAVAIGGWIAGPLSDRIGRRRVMAGSALLLVLPTIGVAVAPTLPAMIASRALQGLLMPGLLTVAVSYLYERIPPRSLGAATGAYTASLVAGGLVARLVPAAGAELGSWRLGLAAIVPIVLVGASLMAWLLPPDGPGRAAEERVGASTHLRDPTIILNGISAGGMGFAYCAVFTYIGFHLAGPPFDLGPGAIGLVYIVWLVGLTTPLLGAWAGRIGPARAAVLLHAVALAGLGVALVDRIPTLVLGLGLLALCLYAVITAAQLLLQRVAAGARGTATALHLSIYYGLFSLGGYLPGVAFEAYGWSGVLACAATALVVGLACAVAAARRVAGQRLVGVGP